MEILFILLLFSFHFLNVSTKTGPDHNKVVICSVASWSVYRPSNGSYNIEQFDPSLCTHVVYAFSVLDAEENTIKPSDAWADLGDANNVGAYQKWTGLKKTFPHLKVLLALGGWNDGSEKYSLLAADANRRQEFAKRASQYLRQHKFDGLELSWEHPTTRGGIREDKENLVFLLSDLQIEFDKRGLLLTTSISPLSGLIDDAYDVRALSDVVDYLHVKCYDYGGNWNKKIVAVAPLKSSDRVLNVEYTIEYLLRLGASPSKIIMGLPFYGRTFITRLEGKYGDAIEDEQFEGQFTKQQGFLGYYEICALLSNKSSGWTSSWDELTSQAIARNHNPETGKTRVVVYDSTRTIARKMRFAVEKKLAGTMMWMIDTDDYLGVCEPETDTFSDFENIPGIKLNIPRPFLNYPLLRAINSAITLSLDEINKRQYVLMLLKFHTELESIDPNDRQKCQDVADTYLRMLHYLLDFYGKYLTGTGAMDTLNEI